MKYRKGDIVSVKAVVRHNCEDDENSVAVDINGVYDAVWPRVQDVTVDQQKIEVGNDVKFVGVDGGAGFGTVLAISNEHAWIDLGDGDYCTRLLSGLKRAED